MRSRDERIRYSKQYYQTHKLEFKTKQREYQNNHTDESREYKHRWYIVDHLEKNPNYKYLPKTTCTNATLPEKAWVAGIIDGEGYVGVVRKDYKNNKSHPIVGYAPCLRVAMTHEETVRKLQDIFGVGSILISHDKRKDFPRKRMFAWVIASYMAHDVLKQILPYLITKKEQAKYLIEYCERCPPKKGGNTNRERQHSLPQRVFFYNLIRRLNGGLA